MRSGRLFLGFLVLCLLWTGLSVPAAAAGETRAQAATPTITYEKTDAVSRLTVCISSETPGSEITCVCNGESHTGTSPVELDLVMNSGGIYITAVASADGYTDSAEAMLYISPTIFESGAEQVNTSLPVLYPDRSAAAFRDVPASAWYLDELNTLIQAGVIDGMTADTFEPKGELKMSQYVKMLVSALYGGDLSEWEDYQIDGRYSTWYAKYVGAALDMGLMEGLDMSRASLESAISRYDMARLLVNAAKILGENLTIAAGVERRIADYYDIPSELRDAVAKAYSAGLLGGYDDEGHFYGDRTLNREQACVTIVRLFDKSARV